MNQIRYGRKAKCGEERERVGSTLGGIRHEEFARLPGDHGEAVRDPSGTRPGTMNQTMYK